MQQLSYYQTQVILNLFGDSKARNHSTASLIAAS